MTAVDLDQVARVARSVIAWPAAGLQGPRELAEMTLAVVAEMSVLREMVDRLEDDLSDVKAAALVLDAERLSAAESAERWKAKAVELPGRVLTLHVVDDHDHVGSHPVVTRLYSNLDPPAVFHDCLACMVTWEEGR